MLKIVENKIVKSEKCVMASGTKCKFLMEKSVFTLQTLYFIIFKLLFGKDSL